jgi:hypothetical protein
LQACRLQTCCAAAACCHLIVVYWLYWLRCALRTAAAALFVAPATRHAPRFSTYRHPPAAHHAPSSIHRHAITINHQSCVCAT